MQLVTEKDHERDPLGQIDTRFPKSVCQCRLHVDNGIPFKESRSIANDYNLDQAMLQVIKHFPKIIASGVDIAD